jgi:hypothetical protein
MPSSLTILSTEHLPEESTLLIHYNISDGGTWNLAQMLTAYRNVIDTGWTVMFPNTQHPRHTDFPITIPQGGSAPGVFAWNYGGVRGIDPENFNNERSYLVQITVYNTDEGTITNQTPAGTVSSQTNVSTGGQVTPANVPTKSSPPRRVPPRTKTPPIRPSPIPPPLGPTPKDTYVHIPPRRTPTAPEPIGDPGTEIPSGPILSAPAPIFPGTIEGPILKDDPSSFYSPPIIYGPNLSAPPKTDDPSIYYPPLIIGPNLSYSPPGGGGAGSIGGGRIPPTTSEGETEPPKLPSTFEIPIELINPNAVPPWWQWPRNNTDPRSVEGPLSFDDPAWLINPWYRPSDPPTIPPIRTQPPKIAVTNNNEPLISSTPIVVTRPNEEPPGGTIGTSNPYQTRLIRTEATASDAGVVRGTPSLYPPIDLTEITTTVGTAGYLSKFNYSEKVQAGTTQETSITHIDTKSIIAGSTLLLEIPIDDISKGSPIFVSSAFTVPTGIEITCRLELWAKDSQNRTILIYSGSFSLAKEGSPASLVYSIESYSFTPGPITLIVLVKDTGGKIVGVASRKIIIRPALNRYGTDANNRIREVTNMTTYGGLPANIVDLLNINRPPVSFYVKESKPVRLLFTKVAKTENKFGMIAVSSSKNVLEKYKIDVFSNLIEGEFIPVPNIKGQYNNIIFSEYRTLLVSSNERIKLDKQELNPESHTVGISPLSTTEPALLVCLVPDTKSEFTEDRQIDIYVNSSYVLKEFSITITKQSPTVYTISGYGPYVIETLGLIVHGKNPDNISENYVIMYANTGVDGTFVWPNVSIQAGEYYSIIAPRYGTYNPLVGKVYTAKL